MCLAWQPGLFPVINPLRMAAGYPSLFLINPPPSTPPPPDSRIPHRVLIFSDTTKETQLSEGENQVSDLSLPPLSDKLAEEDFLSVTFVLSTPPTRPISRRQRRGTPLISPHLSVTSTSSVALTVWQEIPHPAKVTAGKDTHSYSPAGSQFPPHCCSLFLAFMSFLSGGWRERERASGGRIHPILREQAETVQEEMMKNCFCATPAAPRGIWSHNMFLPQSAVSHKHFRRYSRPITTARALGILQVTTQT